MIFLTQYSYKHEEQKKEENSMPSMTIPDESMTIQEMFIRAQKGMPLSIRDNGYHAFSDENVNMDLDTFDNLDLIDIQEIDETLAKEEREHVEKLEKRKKKAQRDELRREIELELSLKKASVPPSSASSPGDDFPAV